MKTELHAPVSHKDLDYDTDNDKDNDSDDIDKNETGADENTTNDNKNNTYDDMFEFNSIAATSQGHRSQDTFRHNSQTPLLTSSSVVADCMADYSPMQSPLTWFVINGVCAVWSGLVFWQLVTEGTDIRDRAHGNELYVAWSLWTTLIWCAESGLSAYHHYHHRHSIRRIDRLVETLSFVVAIYFLLATIQLIYQFMKRPGQRIYGEKADVILSFVSYVLALYYMGWVYRRKHSEVEERSEPQVCEREVSCEALEERTSTACGYDSML